MKGVGLSEQNPIPITNGDTYDMIKNGNGVKKLQVFATLNYIEQTILHNDAKP